MPTCSFTTNRLLLSTGCMRCLQCFSFRRKRSSSLTCAAREILLRHARCDHPRTRESHRQMRPLIERGTGEPACCCTNRSYDRHGSSRGIEACTRSMVGGNHLFRRYQSRDTRAGGLRREHEEIAGRGSVPRNTLTARNEIRVAAVGRAFGCCFSDQPRSRNRRHAGWSAWLHS